MDYKREKKRKMQGLKAQDSYFDGDISFILQNFKLFLRHDKKQKEAQDKSEEKDSFISICFICGKKGKTKFSSRKKGKLK